MGGDGGAPGVAVGVADLRVVLGGRPVLDGVDLDVAAGRVLAVLGPSGGGKTTLLRVVAGLVVPDGGVVTLDGVDQAEVPPHRRGVGLMFQDHQLFPHRDVGANVGFGLRMAGVDGPARRRRVAEVLELVGLAGTEARAVASLSGGEAQRVALARALAPRPGLLLLDEPLGSVDRVLHDRLVADLRRLVVAQGVTVVHVTHDRHEALALADDLAVLDQGRILQVGPAAAVWRAPRTEVAARLLGVDAVVDAVVDGGRVRIDGEVVAVGARLPDGPARLAVRAHAVEVGGPDGPPAPADGSPWLDAVVERVTFAGARSDVVVAVDRPGGLGRLPAEVPGPPPAVGAPVRVRLVAGALHALDG